MPARLRESPSRLRRYFPHANGKRALLFILRLWRGREARGGRPGPARERRKAAWPPPRRPRVACRDRRAGGAAGAGRRPGRSAPLDHPRHRDRGDPAPGRRPDLRRRRPGPQERPDSHHRRQGTERLFDRRPAAVPQHRPDPRDQDPQSADRGHRPRNRPHRRRPHRPFRGHGSRRPGTAPPGHRPGHTGGGRRFTRGRGGADLFVRLFRRDLGPRLFARAGVSGGSGGGHLSREGRHVGPGPGRFLQ